MVYSHANSVEQTQQDRNNHRGPIVVGLYITLLVLAALLTRFTCYSLLTYSTLVLASTCASCLCNVTFHDLQL